MLPKKLRAMHASVFRPIANLRLLYKVFAYLILGRIEHTLDTYQPEKQHGFRSKYRLEEHLLAANLFLDKATARGIPVWLVSLDLSKVFDRVHWPTLWNALRAQGISDHNAVETVRGPIRRSAGQVGIQPQFSHNFWRETRVRPKS